MGPAIRRGAMADLFPQGTPHLDLTDPRRQRIVVAEGNPRQQQRTASTTSDPSVASG
jgi:hypothetical protein